MGEQKKFKKGARIDTVCWFTGGQIVYEVVEVEEGRVSLRETSYNMDGTFSHEPEWYDVVEVDGVECVLLFEYRGHTKYLRACEQYL